MFTPLTQPTGNSDGRALWLLVLIAVCGQAHSDQPHNTADPTAPVAQAGPAARDTAIWVPHNATAASPDSFVKSDFPFLDADSDPLDHITIKSLPLLGTMRVGNSAATAGQNVAEGSINTITYYPQPSQSAQLNYTAFTYSITAGGDESRTATATIHLRASQQQKATGAPTIIAPGSPPRRTYDRGQQLTDDSSDVVDLNIINILTQSWQWQQSPARTGAYADISGATNRIFVPADDQAWMYIRVCISFMDRHTTPGNEGPLCSDGVRIIGDAINLRLRLFLEGPLR